MTRAADPRRRRSDDRAEALRLCPSLKDRLADFEAYESLLGRWQDKINLIAAPTLETLWMRHFADSAQILEEFPTIRRWADLGSGAGFPGLVLAILLKGRPGAEVHLIESDQRKAAFLRAVSRETRAPAHIHVARIEEELPKLFGQVDGVTARALAPLSVLLDWTCEHLLKSAVGAFLKGEDWRAELTGANALDSFDVQAIVSRTNSKGRLIAVTKKPAQEAR